MMNLHRLCRNLLALSTAVFPYIGSAAAYGQDQSAAVQIEQLDKSIREGDADRIQENVAHLKATRSAVPTIREAVRAHSDARLRKQLLSVLGGIPGQESTDALLDLMTDSREDVRYGAIASLENRRIERELQEREWGTLTDAIEKANPIRAGMAARWRPIRKLPLLSGISTLSHTRSVLCPASGFSVACRAEGVVTPAHLRNQARGCHPQDTRCHELLLKQRAKKGQNMRHHIPRAAVLFPVLCWIALAHGQSLSEQAGRASDGAVPLGDRILSVQAIIASESPERDDALGKVVNSASEDVAALAACDLIRRCRPEAIRGLAPRIAHWSEHNQSVVLSRLFQYPVALRHEAFVDPVRMILAGSSQTSKEATASQPALLETFGTSHDHAVVLLGTISRRPDDRNLIRSVLRESGNIRGAWLALAAMGDPEADTMDRARTVYRDPGRDQLLRVAAAVAAAPHQAEAESFLNEVYANIVAVDASIPKGPAITEIAGPEGLASYYSFRRSAVAVSMLRYLHTAAARKWVRKFVECENPEIATLGRLIEAFRWPDEFVGRLGEKRGGKIVAGRAN